MSEKKSKSHRSSRSSSRMSKMDEMMMKLMEKMVGDEKRDKYKKEVHDREAEVKYEREYAEPGPVTGTGKGKIVEVVLGPYKFSKNEGTGVCTVSMRRGISQTVTKTAKGGVKYEFTTDDDNYKEVDVEYANMFRIDGPRSFTMVIDKDVFEKAVLMNNELTGRTTFFSHHDDYAPEYIKYIALSNEYLRIEKLKNEEIDRQGVKSDIALAYEKRLKVIRDAMKIINDNKESMAKITKHMVTNAGVARALLGRNLDKPLWDGSDRKGPDMKTPDNK